MSRAIFRLRSGQGGPAKATYLAEDGDTTDTDTYNFGPHPIGLPEADRRLVVAVGWRTNPNIVSVTVGGVSCTLVVEAAAALVDQASLWITDTPVTVGETAIVTVILDANATKCVMALWRLDGGVGAVADFGGDSITGSGNVDITMNVPQSSTVIAYAYMDANGVMTWTGVDQDFIAQSPPADNNTHSGGHLDQTLTDPTYLVRNTSLVNARRAVVAAAFAGA
jgi:hypothetical protein